MSDNKHWQQFESTGKINDYLSYLSYKRSLNQRKDGDDISDEDIYGRAGDLGAQDGRSGQGDYPFD